MNAVLEHRHDNLRSSIAAYSIAIPNECACERHASIIGAFKVDGGCGKNFRRRGPGAKKISLGLVATRLHARLQLPWLGGPPSHENAETAHSGRRGAAWEKANVMAAKVMFSIHLGRMTEAREVLDAVLAEGFTSDVKLGARLLEDAPVQ